MSLMVLPQMIAAFKELYPKITYRLLIGESLRVIELLEKGVIETAIVHLPVDEDYFASYKLPTERLALVYDAAFFPQLEGTFELPVSRLQGLPLLCHRRYNELLEQSAAKNGIQAYFFCLSFSSPFSLIELRKWRTNIILPADILHRFPRHRHPIALSGDSPRLRGFRDSCPEP